MRVVSIILFLSMMFGGAFGADSYEQILITKTSKKSNLKPIKKRLDKINIKMYIKKSNDSYYVYSGKYSLDDSSAALKRIVKYFPHAKVIVHNQKDVLTDNSSANKIEDEQNFFVAAAVGITSADNLNSALSFNAEGGYIFNENIFASFAYLNISDSDVSLHNVYGSINYNINFYEDMGAYFGVLGGYSMLSADSIDESAMLFGLQAATTYNVYGDVDMLLLYQGIYLNYDVDLNQNTNSNQSANLNMVHNVQLGVKYKF